MNEIAEHGSADSDSSIVRPSLLWLWPVLVPALPILIAVALLQWLGAPLQSINLTDGAMATGEATILRHGSDRLIYAAAMAIHTGLCGSAIVYFGIMLGRIGGSDLRPIVAMMMIAALTVLSAMVALAYLEPPLAIYRYSYFIIAELVGASPLARDLTDINGIPMLSIYVLYPCALGVVAVVMAGGIACASLRRIGPADNDAQWIERLRSHVRLLLHCFYALSAVLVTSTIAASLFFRLPLGLISTTSDYKALHTALAEYTNGLIMFWGAIYTLTLFSTFAAPTAVLYKRAHDHVIAADLDVSVSEWSKQHGIEFSFRRNIMNIFTLVAPLLVEPFTELTAMLGG